MLSLVVSSLVLLFTSSSYGLPEVNKKNVLKNQEYDIPYKDKVKYVDDKKYYKFKGEKTFQFVKDETTKKKTLRYLLFFDTAEAVNDVDFNEFSKEMVSLNKKYDFNEVSVHGHADVRKIINHKTFKDNMDLSLARARFVGRKLKKALPQKKLIVKAYGDLKPAKKQTRSLAYVTYHLDRRVVVEMKVEKKNKKQGSLVTVVKCANEKSHLDSKDLPPMKITVDGRSSPQGKTSHIDYQRCQDIALNNAELEVRFDPLVDDKKLNVSSYVVKERAPSVYFRPYSNYDHFIKKKEVRIFYSNQSIESSPLSVIRDKDSSVLKWKPQPLLKRTLFQYVLRVYDQAGHFDETTPQYVTLDPPHLIKIQSSFPTKIKEALLAGYGETRLSKVNNINVRGGAVTVFGKGVPKTSLVRVLGNTVPVDESGKFVMQQILSHGKTHQVDVTVLNKDKNGLRLNRDLHIPKTDWFFVGLADLLVGGHRDRGPAQIVTQDIDHYQKSVFVDGRLAFYLKGKIKGSWLLTASADTRERPIRFIFNDFLSKDPSELFRRIDPERYYPVYGDDSSLYQDAPTQGRFYVKLKKNEFHVLWGNFRTKVTETELAQVDRGLYGAELVWDSQTETKYGHNKTKVTAFAASPGTVQAREEFRGSGTHYWLQHRDISLGSERVTLEVRDKETGFVVSSQVLKPFSDYHLNAFQGHITLAKPLTSTADQDETVIAGNIPGNSVYLVVRYEYTPGFTEFDSLAVGGRVSQWLGNHFRVGVTGARQTESVNKNTLLAGDVEIKLADNSYIKAEVARTDGMGFREQTSIDSGYLFQPIPLQNLTPTESMAYFGEAKFDFYRMGSRSAHLKGFYKQREAGFSAAGQQSARHSVEWASELDLPVSSSLMLQARHEEVRIKNWITNTTSEIDTIVSLGRVWDWEMGARYDYRVDESGGMAPTQLRMDFGKRIDGAVKLACQVSSPLKLYGFGQSTLNKDTSRLRNDRAGGGFEYQVNNRLEINAEGSGGNQGLGVKAGTTYHIDDQTDVYFSYLRDTLRTDSGLRARASELGTLVSGVRGRYSEFTQVYYENKYLHGEQPAGLTHTFGVDYSPVEKWTMHFVGEKGTVRSQDFLTETDRLAGSVGATYGTKDSRVGASVEYREDETNGTPRETWGVKTEATAKLNETWRFGSKFHMVKSHSGQGEYWDGDWTEGYVGLARRPILDDGLNLLFRYGFTEVLPSSGQVDSSGSIPNFKQRTHLLGIDLIQDLSTRISLGAKYAFAFRRLQNNRVNLGGWFKSDAHLGILRMDVHLPYRWDFLLEARYLTVVQAQDSKMGALAAIYRNLNKMGTLKLGAGYNFSDFSDDLTDLSYTHHGWFVNLVGGY